LSVCPVYIYISGKKKEISKKELPKERKRKMIIGKKRKTLRFGKTLLGK